MGAPRRTSFVLFSQIEKRNNAIAQQLARNQQHQRWQYVRGTIFTCYIVQRTSAYKLQCLSNSMFSYNGFTPLCTRYFQFHYIHSLARVHTHTQREPASIQFACTTSLNDEADDYYYYYFNRSNVLIANLVVEFWSNSKYSNTCTAMLCSFLFVLLWRAFILHVEICSANHFISHSFKAIILLIIIISPNRLAFYHNLWP